MNLNALCKTLVFLTIVGTSAAVLRAQTPSGFEGIENLSFQRSTDDIAANMNHFKGAGAAVQQLPPVEKFRYDYYTGNWAAVVGTLKQMPPDMGVRTYDKMLTDLTSRGQPFMQQEDVVGLIRANPADWNATRLKQLGQLVKVCVSPMQQAWLEKQLTDGVGGLGGKDPAARLNAGRMLINAQFNSLAIKFLPAADATGTITDEAVRAEVVSFLAARAEADALEKQQGSADLARQLALLMDPKSPPAKLKAAKTAFLKLMTEASQGGLEGAFKPLVKENPDMAYELLTELVKKYRDSMKGRNFDLRQQQLYALKALAAICTENTPVGDEKWKTLLQLMADQWVSEVEATYQAKQTVGRTGRLDGVQPQELAVSAPAGKWLAALPKSMAEKVTLNVVRANMMAGAFDQAADSIVELYKTNPEAAVPVAEEFIVAWGERHDPNIPDALRAKYALPEDTYISVTPLMIERNIDGLARILTLFREAGLQYGDTTKLVNAFDAVYGRAEAYQLSHIEKVFGPVEAMSEQLATQLITRMCESLGKKWRSIEMQKANLTRRDESQTLAMTRDGYTAATQIADRWLTKNPDGYRIATLAGQLCNDWADFEYFQKLDSSDSMKRMLVYRQKFVKSQEYFAKAAAAYTKAVPQMAAANYTVDVYVAWFNSLLGINTNGDVNLSKPISRPGLTRIRDSMRSMPKAAADAHVGMFARYITGRMQAVPPAALHEDLKYKYLASSLMITQDNPFTMQARQQVNYYNELLDEIRLQVDFDGPTTVGRDQDFGVVLSVFHTEGMGRMAKLKQQLSNTLPPDVPAKRAAARNNPYAPKVLRMTDVQGPRDALELSIHEALDPFFDVRSITFSRPDVVPRKTNTPGWQQTVLAYIQLRVKDSSVDRVPPVELDLSFIDLGGPVTIPVESAEALLKVQSDAVPPRPVSHVDVNQTLDARQLLTSGVLTLEIKATATGLVPELEEILNLDAMKQNLKVKSIAPHAGTQVREINSWAEHVQATSDREWTVILDAPEEVREGNASATFTFPTGRSADVKVTNQKYDDMNLVPVTEATTEIGQARAEAGSLWRKILWPVVGIVVVAVAGLIAFVVFRKREVLAPAVHARDVFKMPEHIDGFVVVRLLNGLITSPLVHFAPAEKEAVKKDIDHVQNSVFTSNGPGLNATELKDIANKWLVRLG